MNIARHALLVYVKPMKILLLLLISPAVVASIFNGDSRYEPRLEGSTEVIERARALPAFVRTSNLKLRSDGDYDTNNWGSFINFCSDVRFSGQAHVVNCSASLIGPDLVLTAAHCIENLGISCGDYKIIFDFAEGADIDVIKKENVYECAEVVYYNFDETMRADDLAIIRLDRKVIDRNPIAVSSRLPKVGDNLSMIGYPLGLPQKADDDGRVTSVDKKNISFKHDLDTFSCNSGGPIFNEKGSQVGVLVRGTGPNTVTRANQSCEVWHEAKEKDYAEANSLVHLKVTFKKLGVTID